MKNLTSHFNSLDGGGSGCECDIQPSLNDVDSEYPTQILKVPQRNLAIGSIFASRYQIIEKVGKGGMGEVYKALDREIDEKVALKLLNPDIAGDEKTIERFRSELKLARQISHRNVCRMYDLNKAEGTHYIIMEYVAGEDLKSSIRRMGPLNPAKAVFITKQVCEGLIEAHRLGVVHRDLKPQNIMIDPEGNVRIMDFGIARSLKTKGVTDTGVIIGTPEYMSVEQVEGEAVDQRSDVYSLGVILYEMLTAAVPFNGDTPLSIALKHKTQPPPNPREITPLIPEDLSQLILKCMEKDKEKRFQNAEELLTELSRIEKNFSTTEMQLSKRKQLASTEITVTFSLKKIFIPALVFAALVITGVATWQILLQKKALPVMTKKPSLAVLCFVNNSGDESLNYWKSGLADLLITDFSQSKFVRVISEEEIYSLSRKLNLLDAKKISPEDLVRVATQGRVDYVLNGSFVTNGVNFLVTIMIRNSHTGQVISSQRIECKGEEEIPARIDVLTKKIKSDLNLSPERISSDIDKGLDKITTSSPEAYRYYIEGRKNHMIDGDSRKTIEFMEKAIAIDPKFAGAYRIMAGAYDELGYLYEEWNSLQKALELKDRLTEREFYLTQAELYSMSEKTYGKAIKANNKVLEIYPEDEAANYNLGILFCRDLEQWDKAIERFDVLIQNGAKAGDPYAYQALAYMAKGMYDRARNVLENYLSSSPNEGWIREKISQVYLSQGKLDLARRVAEEALDIDSASINPSLLGDIFLYQGDLSNAEREYEKMLNTEESASQYEARFRLAAWYLSQGRFGKSKEQVKHMIELSEKAGDLQRMIWSHSYLAQIHLASGNPDKALEEWKQGWNIAVEESLDEQPDLFLKGRIYLGTKSMDKAQATAEELKKMLQPKMNQKLMRYHHLLMGMILLERENLTEAIIHFDKALSLLPFQHSEQDGQALFIYPLALTYYKTGDLEKSQVQFQKIISLTTGRLFFGDIFARSYYMLGKIFQEKGWGEKAIEHYARFLELWKDADPEIPELEDARDRLAQLKAQT